ncbi:MAG: NADH:flavin oxidoreductase [Spirochaetaceae bacterium]
MSSLLEPLTNGLLKLKNRLVMPPIATSKSDNDGRVNKDILDYYNEKSSGGYIGLFIIEHSYILKQGKAGDNQVSIEDDNLIPELKELAKVIHINGSKAVMQINHAGSSARKEVTKQEIMGPSAVPKPGTENIPKAMTNSDINNLIIAFSEAARRVKEAGFDGVEIHGAHGFLLSQFFSALTNKRTDEYGGDLLKRIKIHIDIIKAVRKEVGDSFPILLRLGAADYLEGGITIDDSVIAAVEFEKAGVNILDISGGFCGFNAPDTSSEGYFSDLTEQIKKVVSIPVILTGGIISAKAAETLLLEEKADLIGVGRAIYNDSSWAESAIKEITL